MRKKRYPSVAPEPRTSAKSLWAEAAEIGVYEIDAPAVLQAEGYLPKGGTPSAGKYNVSLGSPPQAEVQDEVPFTGGSGEGWSENSPYALSVDSATALSGVCSRVIKGWSFDSPVGLSNSPMIAIRTSPDDALGEAAEISLDVHNETAVLQMEGGLPAGSAPYRNALGVGAESKLVACSSEGWSENSPSEAGNNELHVEWEVPQRSWKVPPHVVQFKHRVSTIRNERTNFPTWFELSDADDQLGLMPVEWNIEKCNAREERDLQEAIRRSIDDINKSGEAQEEVFRAEDELTINGSAPGLDRCRAESLLLGPSGKAAQRLLKDTAALNDKYGAISCMAVSVKGQKVSQKQRNRIPEKGKGISAAERSTGFAEYLRQAEEYQGNAYSSKAGSSRKEAKSKHDKKVDGPMTSYMRASSQIPEGGWFRKSTASASDPPNTSDSSSSSSAGSSSSGYDSSSDDHTSSSSSSSQSSCAEGKKKHKNMKKKAAKKKSKRARMRKVMSGIKLKAPFIWDAEPDLDVFDQWTYEVDTWAELTGLKDSLVLKIMVNFMSGMASKFFMNHVATDQKSWTVKEVYEALFEYCFPVDFKLQLRKRLMSARQDVNTVRDFVRDLRSLAKRFPDVTERNLVQIFWDGVHQYVRLKWLDKGFSPEDIGLEKLVKWAVRFEKSKEALMQEELEWQPAFRGNKWSQFKPQAAEDEVYEKEASEMEDIGSPKPSKELDESGEFPDPGGKSARAVPRWSEEEKDQLRAENRCFNCTEIGHRSRNCPEKHGEKASNVSVGAARFEYSSEQEASGDDGEYSTEPEEDGSDGEDTSEQYKSSSYGEYSSEVEEESSDGESVWY